MRSTPKGYFYCFCKNIHRIDELGRPTTHGPLPVLERLVLDAIYLLREDAVQIDGEWGMNRTLEAIRKSIPEHGVEPMNYGSTQVDLSDRLEAALQQLPTLTRSLGGTT